MNNYTIPHYNNGGGLLNNITSPLKLYSIGGNSYDC